MYSALNDESHKTMQYAKRPNCRGINIAKLRINQQKTKKYHSPYITQETIFFIYRYKVTLENYLLFTLTNVMNDVVANTHRDGHPEIMHHGEGFDFVPANRTLSAVEVGLVNAMSRETVLKQYLDGVKSGYDYVLLDCRPSLGIARLYE